MTRVQMTLKHSNKRHSNKSCTMELVSSRMSVWVHDNVFFPHFFCGMNDSTSLTILLGDTCLSIHQRFTPVCLSDIHLMFDYREVIYHYESMLFTTFSCHSKTICNIIVERLSLKFHM